MRLSFISTWGATIVLAALVGSAWAAVGLIGGTLGPLGWWALMGLGIVGVGLSLVGVTALAAKIVHRKAIHASFITFVLLALLTSWPAGWLFGIGQIAYPANLNTVGPQASIRLPLERTALVAWGGDALKENYHAWMPCQRWAYDLLIPPAAHKSQNLEDYGIYGEVILAPANGTIIGTYDDEPDIRPGSEEFSSQLGNHIFIRLEETGTYLVLAHLKQDSVQVGVGEFVAEGTPIAQVGNSGTTSEPHLHIHHQRQNPTQGSLLLAEGLPLFFRDVNGSAMPRGGVEWQNGVEVPVGEMIAPAGVHEN